MSNDDVFKSPLRLRFGKSPKKSEKKKRRINLSPSQHSPIISPNKTIVDIEQEDQYNYQSLSQRLNAVEKENEILKLRIANLENENSNLKANVDQIKNNLDVKSREISDITLKIDNIQTSFSAVDSEDNALKRKTYASVVAGVDFGKEADIDTLFVEQTQRMAKEKNVVISGFSFDTLNDRETVLSVVTGLIQELDNNILLTDCKRLKNKTTNQWINKVIVSFSSVANGDKIINKSKLHFKGKGIFINPDLTKLQMELEYKLRQEKKRLINNLSEEDRNNCSFYIKGKTIFKYDKINKVHSVFKDT